MTPEIKAKIQSEAERRIPHLKGDSVETNLTRSGFIIGFNAGASYYDSIASLPIQEDTHVMLNNLANHGNKISLPIQPDSRD